ncbi:hypothetical protein V502_03452 [Pseudogymnoascus sp. VKM F-4520 (FW-2644)]|nr:hypothetical protein V502_03452 [Pseudogymnoascus sp. VKM F-4520 (FW-2644)]
MVYIPKSTFMVDVQLINTTTDITVKSSDLLQPELKGQDTLYLPTFAFLIRHRASGRSVLFDCGSRKDWKNLPPAIVPSVSTSGVHIEKSVDEILIEGGQDLNELSSIIWSHWHWDHIGDASRFPTAVELVVGPNFKENFMPGYPTKKDALLLDSDFEGRNVREIAFSGNLKIGGFPAHDFFGDGSLYLLDAPGHAVGHIAGLARTTANTFVLLGGDSCHFPGVFRPSTHLTLPSIIPSTVRMDARFPRPCPSSCFTCIHPVQDKASSTPFYSLPQATGGWYVDPPRAQESVASLSELDGDEDILVLIAHDMAMLEIKELFPNYNINAWKEKGWKERFAWSFLNELPDDSGRARREFDDAGRLDIKSPDNEDWRSR